MLYCFVHVISFVFTSECIELQIRILMGEAVGRSLVVGVQNEPPQFAAIQSASCPTTGACDATNALFSETPNPQIAYGALIYGDPLSGDAVQNTRTDYSNQAAVSQAHQMFTSKHQIK